MPEDLCLYRRAGKSVEAVALKTQLKYNASLARMQQIIEARGFHDFTVKLLVEALPSPQIISANLTCSGAVTHPSGLPLCGELGEGGVFAPGWGRSQNQRFAPARAQLSTTRFIDP